MIIRYKLGRSGEVMKEILAGGVKRAIRGEDRPIRHFSEQLLKSYYDLECRDGSRFQSIYTKNVIKHVHDTALARFDELGQEH